MDQETVAMLREVEQAALRAHRRWRARRAARVRGWVCVGLGVAVGAGFTAILLGLTGALL